MYYELDENHVVHPVGRTVHEVGADFGAIWDIKRRRVRLTEIRGGTVSTVFLVFDHNFGESGTPVLFETMVFIGDEDEQCERCCTWDEAVEQHERIVASLAP